MKKSGIKTQDLTQTLNDPRWEAVLARDPQADGTFSYAVRTTGVYCRPSCPSRRAKPENIRFYTTCAEAEQAGYRPCQRCRPDLPALTEQHAAMVTEACRILSESENEPRLEQLARQIGMSMYHFHRIFKQITGLTPRGYRQAMREQRLRENIAQSSAVTEAIYASGYNSSSSFYTRSEEILGMTPTNYRAGGTNEEIRFAIGECSLGTILVAQSRRGICAILLGSDPEALARDLQDRFPNAQLVGDDREFEELVAHVIGFVEMPGIGLDLPLDVRGTTFQQRVWQALREIPAGKTKTYTEIANCIGAPKSVRAVAQACAANGLAVAIPCHRVVRMDGSLSGYRWGVERKRALLDMEARHVFNGKDSTT